MESAHLLSALMDAQWNYTQTNRIEMARISLDGFEIGFENESHICWLRFGSELEGTESDRFSRVIRVTDGLENPFTFHRNGPPRSEISSLGSLA